MEWFYQAGLLVSTTSICLFPRLPREYGARRKDSVVKASAVVAGASFNYDGCDVWDICDIHSTKIMKQKIEYIHYNPVKAGFVELAEHWKFSSARNYLGGDNAIIPVKIFLG